jgi:hypothetical protein
MNRKLALFALPALLVAGFASAQSVTLTFDDTYVPTGWTDHDVYPYEWFTTTGVGVLRVDDNAALYPNGYWNMAQATGSEQMAYLWGPEATVGTFTYASEGTFTLNSFSIANAHGNQTLIVTGYSNGEVVDTLTLDWSPTDNPAAGLQVITINFDNFVYAGGNWSGLDSFSIAVAGDLVPITDDMGRQWVLDNLTFTPTAVPEPGIAAMFGVGLAVVGLLRRRQSKLRK